MLKVGIVTYNMYANFTNYGSALQTYALYTVLKNSNFDITPVVVDYCPNILIGVDPRNPFQRLWDKDEDTLRRCKNSLDEIITNADKFDDFYNNKIIKTKLKYTSENFCKILDEGISRFVCGSDTIFCVNEFGIDDGYFANYPCMKNGYTIAYAASFGDINISEKEKSILKDRLSNFKFLGIRESSMLGFIQKNLKVPSCMVADPTLLLKYDDLDSLCSPREIFEDYILFYSRRYNKMQDKYVDDCSNIEKIKVVEISINSDNKDKHIMRYGAGVDEFLSLVKYSKKVITNSYHGMIMAIRYSVPVVVFSREQCDNKIEELLNILGVKKENGEEYYEIDKEDYQGVHKRMERFREDSLRTLSEEVQKMIFNYN